MSDDNEGWVVLDEMDPEDFAPEPARLTLFVLVGHGFHAVAGVLDALSTTTANIAEEFFSAAAWRRQEMDFTDMINNTRGDIESLAIFEGER